MPPAMKFFGGRGSKTATAEEAFRSIDTNGDGKLSVDELLAAMGEAGAKDWPRSRIVYIVAMLDGDGDQRLSIDEFKKMLAYLERGHAVQDELQQAYRTIDELQRQVEALRRSAATEATVPPAQAAEGAPLPGTGMRATDARDALVFDTVKAFQKEHTRERVDTAAQLHSKYAASGENFTFEYAGIEQFFAGLEGLVGVPAPEVRHAMAREHASTETFSSHNVFDTTPKIEWEYVTTMAAGEAQGRGADACAERVTAAHSHWKLADFVAHPDCRRASLIVEEVIGIRLYTGYVWYNNRTLRKRIKGQYTTTLHAINSAILKLARHTRAATVYRGVVGGVLPDAFWQKNEHGIRGGIELGFMSTTTQREVATGFATAGQDNRSGDGNGGGGGVASMVFVIHMGMIDRGASVSFLSQFPAENEILFAPLTGLEVVGTPLAEGGTLLVELRLSCNMHDLTLEEVIGKMQKSHTTLIETIVENNVFAGAPERMLAPLRALHAKAAERGRAYFNVPELFQQATGEALEARAAGFRSLAAAEAWAGEQGDGAAVAERMRSAAKLCAREEQHDCAAELLVLAVEREPKQQRHLDAIAAVARRASKPATERAEMAMLALCRLLESGDCREQPWPLTTVRLSRAVAGGEARKAAASNGHSVAAAEARTDNFSRLLATSFGVPTSAVMPPVEVMPQLFDEDATASARKGSALLDAANRADPDGVRDALATEGVGANDTVANGVTALMLAARQADLESTAALLTAGAAVNARSRNGIAALNLAAEQGAERLVSALLQAGAAPDNADDEGKTPLVGAALAGITSVVRALCSAGVDVGRPYGPDKWTALLRASQRGDVGVIEVLLQHQADVNATQAAGISPLVIAAQEGRTAAIGVLLGWPGVQLDQALPDGRTPLYQASKNGHVDAVKALLAAGAKVGCGRFNCCDVAKRGGFEEIVSLLQAAM